MSELFDDLDAPPEEEHDVVLSEEGNFTIIPNSLVDSFGRELGPTGIAVYVALKSHANRAQGMRTFVASKTIAKDLGMGESTVRRDLTKMSEMGLVSRHKRNHHSTVYFISTLAAPTLPNRTDRRSTLPNSIATLPNSDITRRTINQKKETKVAVDEESIIINRRAVETVYYYYVSLMKKNPKLYKLTAIREKKLLTRLSECLSDTDGDLEKAVELMKCAVDGLAANDFCMGRKPGHPEMYNDLIDNIFKSYEEMEKRWN